MNRGLGRLRLARCTSILVVTLTLAAVPRAEGDDTIVRLRVENASAWSHEAQPVSFGLPLPRALGLLSAAELGILDPSGRPVPLQGTVLARWGGAPDDPAKPVKWVLLDFQASMPAGAARTFTLVRGAHALQPADAVHVREDREWIEVSTGIATFRISRDRFSLFDEVRLRDRGAGDVTVARAREADGLEYRAPGSRRIRAGRPDSARVEIQGAQHAIVNVRGRFVDAGGRPGPLYYVARYHFYAGRGEARLFLTVTDRHDRPSTEGQWDKRWDAQNIGDLRLALSLAEPARTVLLPRSENTPGVDSYGLPGDPAQLRLTQLSPHSYRLTLTEQDRVSEQKGYMEVAGLNWLPRADWPGFQGHDFLVHDADGGRSSVRWVAPLARPGRYRVSVALPALPGYAQYLAAKDVTYEVRFEAGVITRTVDHGTGGPVSLGVFDFRDRVEVTVRATGQGKVVADALWITPVGDGRGPSVSVDRDQAAGWVCASGRQVGMSVGLREFWQNAPKELLIAGDGRIDVGLLPGGPHHFMGGLGKTHEIVFSPRLAASRGAPARDGGAFLRPPLHALAPPEWYSTTTQALGHVRARRERGASPEERQFETLIERAIDPARASLSTEVEQRQWYGWRNYGDFEVGAPYWSPEGPVEDWANGMMDYATGLLVQYLRTGRQPYWTLGRAAAWHLADIGLVKFHPFDPKSNGTVHRKGECLRSRSHVCQDPIAGQAFAHRSLLLLYQLTGDSWFLETALMNVDYAYEFASRRLGVPTFLAEAGRDMGWILEALLTGYEQTGQSRYLDLAKQLFERKLVAQHDPVTGAIINRDADNAYAPARAPMIQPWMVGYTGAALAHYHAITGDARAPQLVVGLARFLRDFGTRRVRVPAKGEPGHTALIPEELAGKSPRYVLYTWTYEQQRTQARVTVRQVDRGRLGVAYEDGEHRPRATDLRGKLLFVTSGAAAARRFLIWSATDGTLAVGCRRGTEGVCSDDLAREGLRPGDTALIIQPDEYRIESVTYNFVVLDTLAFATRQTGDPSYLQVARDLFAYAIGVLGEQGFTGPRHASDYLATPRLFLDATAGTGR
jgi:hypothetical protein